jgi:hypothetical protein
LKGKYEGTNPPKNANGGKLKKCNSIKNHNGAMKG